MTNYPFIILRYNGTKYDWYEVIEDCKYEGLIIPKGFKTDFASVPQLFWTIIPAHGRASMPSVVHDFMYQYQHLHPYNRKEVDLIWLGLMKESGTPKVQRLAMYHAVRTFGAGHWNRYARNTAQEKALD